MKYSRTTHIATAALVGTILSFGAMTAQAGNYQDHVVPAQHQHVPEHHAKSLANEYAQARVARGNYQTHLVPAQHQYLPESHANDGARAQTHSRYDHINDHPQRFVGPFGD